MPAMVQPRGSISQGGMTNPIGTYYTPETIQGWGGRPDPFNRQTEHQFGQKRFDSDLDMQKQQGMYDMTAFDRQAARDEAEKDRQLQLMIARIKAGENWDDLLFNSSNSVIGSIAGKGYIDEGQHGAATGRYGDVSGSLAKQRGVLEGVQGRGLFTDAEMADMQRALGDSDRVASGLANDGGVDHNYDAGTSGMRENMDRLSGVAARGKYTGDEVAQMEAAAKSEVEDKYRAAAQSAYNAPGGMGMASFAGAGLLAKGASEGGKARAGVKAGITREQADSRMEGAKSAAGIGGALGELSLGLGRNKLSGAGLKAQIANALSSVYGQHAGGRMQAGQMLSQILGQEAGIADRLAGLDTSTMPDYVKKILEDAMGDKDELMMRRERGRGGMTGGGYRPGGSSSRTYQNKKGNWVQERTTRGPSGYGNDGGAVRWRG